jgi:microcystin-dependent protein
MAITVNFTDATNGSLTVEDSTLDSSQISLTLIGKNASNYSTAINENFLHLLENFADQDPPINLPVEGRLWYDTTDTDVPRLRVQRADGTYPPVAGVWQQTTRPGSNESDPRYGGPLAGDLWVDTTRGQLYLNTDGGEDWILVGPQFSSSLKTGSYPDTVSDSFGAPHLIIKNYINDAVVEIIANESFIPQQKIDGFTNILPGVNISSNNNAIINGTTYAAQRLYVTSPSNAYVTGNSFVRNDIDNAITAVLTVENGILIGAGRNLSLLTSGTRDADIINNKNEGRIRLITYNNNLPTTLLNVNGKDYSVGINLPSGRDPATGLTFEVEGKTRINGIFEVNNSGTQVFSVSGNADFNQAINVLSTATFRTTSTFVGGIRLGQTTSSNSVILLPLTDGRYDAGTVNNRFREIYAITINGDLNGTASTATSLANTATWSLAGQVKSNADVIYRGIGGTYTFVTSLDKTAITAQTTSSLSTSTDWGNFYSVDNGKFQLLGVQTTGTSSLVTNVVQIERKKFLADIIQSLIPAGAIMPYAGLTPPDGWLLCDGSTINKADYPNLWLAIGLTYGQPVTPVTGDFNIPDLRGRMVLGYSDMYNSFNIGSLSTTTGFTSAATPNGSLGSAAAVKGGYSTATISIGTGTTGVINTSTGSIISSVMNPYLAMNYIIKV